MNDLGPIGTATLQRADDGTITVLHADPVIALTSDLVAALGTDGHLVDGVLTLDTAGDYRYEARGRTAGGNPGRDDYLFVRVGHPAAADA